MRTRAQGADTMATGPMALDIPYLANTFSFPEPDLQTLVDAPTAELVRTFLALVETKGHELDQISAAKLRADVELENTVRSSETKTKAQKSTVTKQTKEIEELRVKLNTAEATCGTLSTELERVRLSSSGSTAETQALRQRIESLEESNRDALGLVESKSTEKDRVAQELAEQHGKLLGLRREIGQLEERNQALENAASSQKFKEQSLQQEIDLLKRNNEWHSNELQTRNQEHAKFRKERNARIASLQRDLEESTASVDTLKRTESTLRHRLDELQVKADEAFAKIAGLEEDFSRREQGWKTEMDGSKRLAELQAQNAATHRARLQDVQVQVDQIKDHAAEEIGRLQAEIETERSDKEQAESKVADLELKVERLEQHPRASRPGTPMRNGALDPATPGRTGSPFVVPGSTRKMEKMTHTQYITKINELQQDLLAEERRTAKLSQAMDEILATIESREPELLELRSEQSRLEEEVLNFSRLLDEANETRDSNAKAAERWQGEAEARAREGEILRQQLRDLSTQVKILLVEIQSRDQGLESMSGPERFQLEQAARGELEDWAQNESLTQQLISQRLVIFRDVEELQKQNAEQLRMLRLFGEQMEGEEARQKAAQSENDAQQVEALTQQVARYKDELQATATQIDSYMKERDMFRRMLRHRGNLEPGSDVAAMFGQSVPPATPQRQGPGEVAQTPRSRDVDDMHTLLKEQQTFFDQYRSESSTDRQILKDQVDGLGREKSGLQAELAHWKSQKTLADERLQMLQSNFTALRNENVELQKRSQQLAENAAKQDLRTQQVAEDLVEARSMAESLRNESANVKAEKDLWKRIESRLTDDNKNLMDERSRLNKLVGDLQNLQNERELSDSETRRRLQGRVESLESELSDTKRKIEQEVEDARRAALRREYEEGQARTRIDDLVKSLGNVREELVAATTTRDQLQARVDELKIDLRLAEEKVTALQPRPTPRPSASQQNGDAEDELLAEQRLALELSELRRDLELARNELDVARQQVEQYKNIAQSTEEELQSFNETSEQYKDETDRLIGEKDVHAQALQQRNDDLLAELTTTNSELSELRTKHDDFSRTLHEQKASYESELARLRDDTDRHAEEKKLYQADLKAQADIAQQAQQSYEDELLKHAEAARSLQSVKKEYNELRTEVAGVRAEAEAAKATLTNAEESWQSQKEIFEREFEEVKRRRADADEQNRRLHAQMEAFSSEVAALKAGRTVAPGNVEDVDGTPSFGANDTMQEVVRYLRREKEIVDVQYELSMQEAKRLQQQLEYANSQLEEARLKLAEERRQSTDKIANEGSTNKLMQTINELNLFRESSTTLRNEARQAREQLEERSREIERLALEMEPLKGRITELEGELEGSQGEVRLLQEDRDHWRERTQNIISKYDRVDPAELEEMKKQLESLKVEKERLDNEQAPLREQVVELEKAVAKLEESNKKLEEKLEGFRNQAKEQNRKQNQRIRDAEAAKENANAEKTKVEEELAQVNAQLQQVAEQATETTQQSEANADATTRLAEKENEVAELKSSAETLQTRVTELESQAASLQAQLENALQGEEGEVQSAPALDTGTLDKLKQELAIAQQEVETLRTNAANGSGQDQSMANAQTAPEEKSVAEQVAEQVSQLRSEMEQQHVLAIRLLEEDRDRRLEAMKSSLRQKLKDEKDKIQQELLIEHSAQLQGLRDEHASAIATLKQEHQAELERLSKDGGAAVAKAAGDAAVAGSQPQTPTEWPTETQMMDMMKNNARVKSVFLNNVNKRIVEEKATFLRTLAEKEETIAELQRRIGEIEAQGGGNAGEDQSQALQDLRNKLAQAEEEKQAAVKQATENANKKAALQANMLGNMQAKLQVVRKAVTETPEKTIKEVWEIADKAKAPPKPAAPTSAASPVTGTPKPTVPSSPTQAQPPGQTPAQATTQTPTQPQTKAQQSAVQEEVTDQSEQDKIQQRQARFGIVPAPTLTGTFGQPSTLPAKPGAPTTSTFGQPSQPPSTGAFGQRPRRPSMATASGPNPQAVAFTPAPDANASVGGPPKQNVGTGPQALRGIAAAGTRGGFGGIPRSGGAAGRGGAAGQAQNINFQGAAAAAAGQRGGGAGSGIPRGGGATGRGGASARGGGNAGQKRALEGSEGGGDGKRMRGGGPGGA